MDNSRLTSKRSSNKLSPSYDLFFNSASFKLVQWFQIQLFFSLSFKANWKFLLHFVQIACVVFFQLFTPKTFEFWLNHSLILTYQLVKITLIIVLFTIDGCAFINWPLLVVIFIFVFYFGLFIEIYLFKFNINNSL